MVEAEPQQPPTKYHIIAIGGAGMSAIATLLSESGHVVSGSDAVDSQRLNELEGRGVTVVVGHDAANIGNVDVVVASTAVTEDNPEFQAARERGIPVLRRKEFLTTIAHGAQVLAVTGTHGKTTTSSMLAVALDTLRLDPSFLIGSSVPQLQRGDHLSGAAHRGVGDYFVLEADESDGSFSAAPRFGAILTNLEADHLDFWGTYDALEAACVDFLQTTVGPRVYCLDDPGAQQVAKKARTNTSNDDSLWWSYGQHGDARVRVHNIGATNLGATFTVQVGNDTAEVNLRVLGTHNVLNATAVIALLVALGIDLDRAAFAVGQYQGVQRRFERRGSYNGIDFVDDYAHLPTEIQATVQAARSGDWNRRIGIFQPHRFTRTQRYWDEFAASFRGLDALIILDIYPASEPPIPNITSKQLTHVVTETSGVASVQYLATFDDVVAWGVENLQPGDLCLSLGAGSVTELPDLMIRALADVGHGQPDTTVLIDQLANATELPVEFDKALGRLTTYKVGGTCDGYVRITTQSELEQLLGFTADLARNGIEFPVAVVGKGSNLLVADRGFRGLVVQLDGQFAVIEQTAIDQTSIEAVATPRGETQVDDTSVDAAVSSSQPSGVIVRAGGAVSLPVLARKTVSWGLSGFEWGVGVPGSIGGAVRMNAGGHGSDMAAVVVNATVADLHSGHVRIWDATELDFGYRHSAIQPHHVVCGAELLLESSNDPDLGDRLSEIVQWRRHHQPGGQNAGSVFRNPDGDSAGRLIEAAGCSGLRIGTAEVSTKHANFIQADPGGNADDVLALMQTVQRRVLEQFNVRLHPETVLIGYDRTDFEKDSIGNG